MGSIRHAVALALMLAIGIPLCLLSWLVGSAVQFMFQTVYDVLPNGAARVTVGFILAHAKGTTCLRCGERAPSIGEILRRMPRQ
jgi:hypothetical protein